MLCERTTQTLHADSLRARFIQRSLRAALAMLFAIVVVSPALAGPGDLDPTFAPIISNAYASASKIYDVVVAPDGKILIAGDFTTVNGSWRMAVARLNSDGTLDENFAVPLDYGIVRKIRLNADGTMFIGGNFRWGTSVDTIRELALLNENGSLAQDFDLRSPNFMSTTNEVRDILVEPSGTIVIGGQFYYLKNQYVAGLVRLDRADGFQPLGPSAGLTNDLGTALTVMSIARQSDGKLIVGGTFVANGGRHGLIRTLADGNVDGTFQGPGTGSSNYVNRVAVQGDGKVLAVGTFSTINNQTAPRLVRLNTDGTLDNNRDPLNTFSMGGPLTMKLQSTGKLLLGGILGPINNTDRNGVARLTQSLGLDSFYPNPSGIDGEVWAIDEDSTGRVIVGGFFNHVGGVSRPTIARLLDTPNSAPQLTGVSLSPSVDEGSSVTLTGSVSDADGDALTLSVNWGDGSTATVGPYASGANFNLTHAYADDGVSGTSSDLATVSLSLADGNGGTASESPTVTVNNVVPLLTGVSVSPSPATAGTSVTLSATVVDAGTLDTHTIDVDWGDGSNHTTLTAIASGAQATPTHTYAAANTYQIALVVTDDDQGQNTGGTSLTVNAAPPSAPAAPSGFNAVVRSSRVGKKTVYTGTLNWTDNSGNETGFLVHRYVKYRKSCVIDSAFGTKSASVDATSFTDSTATSSTCGYAVAATNAVGTSTYVIDLNVAQ